MKDTAAIILCAGKGSRMKDNSKSKVCFDCAGIPVIRRIIDNMKQAGVSRFVVVIGHQAYSVMDCLDQVDGVVYAYQKEQKGTGHAALCGLKALSSMGYSGPVIVSMGDYAASGGYYISCAADYIVADPTTLTGSIVIEWTGYIPHVGKWIGLYHIEMQTEFVGEQVF